jgi:hypothetical protein
VIQNSTPRPHSDRFSNLVHWDFHPQFLVLFDGMKINVLDRIPKRVVLNLTDQRDLFRGRSTFRFQGEINQNTFGTRPMQRFGNFTAVEL